MTKNKNIRKKRQDSFKSTIDDKIDKTIAGLHAGDMGIHIGDACLRYSVQHSMMVPTAASHNILNPDIPKCGYSEKCDYRTEKDKDDIRYCGYFESKLMNYWQH